MNPWTYTTTRKIGRNKGKPRLWIEGQALLDAGFYHGTRWTLSMGDGVMSIITDDEGKRKVSGKADRPVIDIAGSSLGALGECSSVTLHINRSGWIDVRPCIEETNPSAERKAA